MLPSEWLFGLDCFGIYDQILLEELRDLGFTWEPISGILERNGVTSLVTRHTPREILAMIRARHTEGDGVNETMTQAEQNVIGWELSSDIVRVCIPSKEPPGEGYADWEECWTRNLDALVAAGL